MRFSLRTHGVSLLISAAIHASLFFVPPAKNEEMLGHSARVQTVHLVGKRQTERLLNMNPIHRPKRRVLREEQNTDVPSADGEGLMSQPEVLGAANGPASAASGSQEENISEEAWESTFVGLTTPCRSIDLPRPWVLLKQFWPRKYQLEYHYQHSDGEWAIDVRQMRPIDTPAPAVDQRIRSAFANCLNRELKNSKTDVDRGLGALNPSAGKAYSITLEFNPGSHSVASQQGM